MALKRDDSSVPLDDREPVEPQTTTVCEHCKADAAGRNLILSFDGTSNQYGNKNTNVIELYARIIKNDSQLTYYNSGIGTYARPSWRSYKYWKQVIDNHIDLAIAWNFERGVLAGYRWLSNHYRPGDKIFLFGFSRGAHQIRTLAAMIAKVGLILPGNEEQIAFAYELYGDLNAHSNKGYDGKKSAQFFKETFCQKDVRIHFLGAWDAVSSVGIVRGKNLPGTDTFNRDICFFRHALALDERRVKFLPEYICGGESYEEQRRDGTISEPRVKEVWFAGSHSDIGGGVRINEKLNNAAVPVLWMGHEALRAGLRIEGAPGDWKWEELETSEPTESLTGVWRFFEFLPFKRLSYEKPGVTCKWRFLKFLFKHEKSGVTWWPHLSQGRVIKPGQRIHASVAFIKNYRPKATLPEGTKKWEDILCKGDKDGILWTRGLEDILERDLFDLSNTRVLIENAMSNDTDFDRLCFLSSISEGAASIARADPVLRMCISPQMLDSTTRRLRTGQMLVQLASDEAVRRTLTWAKAISAMVADAVEVPSSPQANVVFELLSLLFRDGTQHFNFEESKITTHLETLLDQLPANDPNTSLYRLVFGEWSYTRYLRGRTGIQYGVSTFEHYFRHTLRTSQSQSPPPLGRTCPSYLNKAMESYRVGLTSLSIPSCQDYRCEYLVKLATCLLARFVEMGLPGLSAAGTDLDEAVDLLREALDLFNTRQSSGRAAIHTNLADALTERFKQSKNSTDIEDAIQLYREALTCYPQPGIGRGIALHNLANALSEQCIQDSKNLDECIQMYQQSLVLISPSDPTLARSLTNLAGAIQRRGAEMDDTEAIDKAILLYQDASTLCLPVDLTTCLNSLGDSFCEKHKNSGDLPVIREAVTHFNYFLELRNPDASTSLAGVTLEVHRLLGNFGYRKPDRSVGHDGNLVDNFNKVQLYSGWQEGSTYGFTIRNTSEENLFPYLFFFDPVDYTISPPIYLPPADGVPPLRSRDAVSLGMGPEHGFVFSPNRYDTSFRGFLKLFVSTERLDLQWSPLGMGRIQMTGDPFQLPSCQWEGLSVSITSGAPSNFVQSPVAGDSGGPAVISAVASTRRIYRRNIRQTASAADEDALEDIHYIQTSNSDISEDDMEARPISATAATRGMYHIQNSDSDSAISDEDDSEAVSATAATRGMYHIQNSDSDRAISDEGDSEDVLGSNEE